MMKLAQKPRLTATNQDQGFVLVSAVMLLVVLTLLILSMLRSTVLEERMVGNSRDWNNAFQAAEAGLRDAERDILSGTRIFGLTGFVAGCNDVELHKGLCLPNTCPSNSDCAPVWVQLNDSGWTTGSGTSKSVAYGEKTAATALPHLAAQPRYIIEALTVPAPDSAKFSTKGSVSNLYRITAVGFGMSASSRVMLQAVIRPNK